MERDPFPRYIDASSLNTEHDYHHPFTSRLGTISFCRHRPVVPIPLHSVTVAIVIKMVEAGQVCLKLPFLATLLQSSLFANEYL
jgi:hypothetical protein